jgi:hypothetical protein
MMKRRAFITLIDGAAAAVCSRTRAAALPTDRAICNARVPHAIGQSFDWLVSAEAELLGARGIPTNEELMIARHTAGIVSATVQ